MDPDRAALLARIKPAWQHLGPARFLIYGPKGGGKTVICARADDSVVLDVEDSKRSLLNHEDTVNVPCLPVDNFNDMDDIGLAIREGDLKCKTLIIDGFDKLMDDTVRQLLLKACAADPKRDPLAASQLEFRYRNELIKRLAADWMTLGVNLVFITHAEDFEDKQTERVTTRPNLSGGLRDFMGGYVTLQGYLTAIEAEDINKTKRHLQVHPSRRIDAKTRIGGLPRIVDLTANPSIQPLINAHYAGGKAAQQRQKEKTK